MSGLLKKCSLLTSYTIWYLCKKLLAVKPMDSHWIIGKQPTLSHKREGGDATGEGLFS